MFISFGNPKIGKMLNFSLPRETCVCATKWCRENCYGMRRLYRALELEKIYECNYILSRSREFPEIMIHILRGMRRKIKIMRVHTVGDFYSKAYVEKWIRIASELPDWRFYCYTRAWQRKKIREKLEELRSLDNFVVYASTDPYTGEPPEGWLEAGIEKCYRKPYKYCDKMNKCDECLYCVYGRGNVAFKVI